MGELLWIKNQSLFTTEPLPKCSHSANAESQGPITRKETRKMWQLRCIATWVCDVITFYTKFKGKSNIVSLCLFKSWKFGADRRTYVNNLSIMRNWQRYLFEEVKSYMVTVSTVCRKCLTVTRGRVGLASFSVGRCGAPLVASLILSAINISTYSARPTGTVASPGYENDSLNAALSTSHISVPRMKELNLTMCFSQWLCRPSLL